MPINKSNILIILPAFNEATVIGKVLTDIKEEGFHNICLIDDGSTDRTGEIAKAFGVKVITHLINRGAGAAIQSGISYAKISGNQYAIMIDGDGQHLASDIPLLYNKMQETNADIIIGNRFISVENSIPKHRITYNQIANLFTNLFCQNKYKDTQSGFRLLNRRAIEKLELKNKGFGFCSEMIIKADKLGLNIEEAPIQVLYTDYSMNKGQSLGVGFKTARSILWQFFFN